MKRIIRRLGFRPLTPAGRKLIPYMWLAAAAMLFGSSLYYISMMMDATVAGHWYGGEGSLLVQGVPFAIVIGLGLYFGYRWFRTPEIQAINAELKTEKEAVKATEV